MVDVDLVFRVHAADRVENLAVHGLDRLQDALAEIALLVAVSELDRLMRAGRGAGRHRGAAEGAVFQRHVDLDGRISAAVENLAAGDVDDGGHLALPAGSRGFLGEVAAERKERGRLLKRLGRGAAGH